MSRVEQLLAQYVEEHRRGAGADPRPYLERLEGAERARLEALIDEYLVRAPRREWDESAYAQSPAPAVADALARSLGGASGLWPSLLPRLRNRAKIKRADLVRELAARLGVAAQREKVARYYNQMEQGLLPADGVADSVLVELGRLLGQSAEMLRNAGRAISAGDEPAARAMPAFARMARVEDRAPQEAVAPPSGEWDEVDQLFRGGG